MSMAPIAGLKAHYGLTEAYSHFSLDPFAYLSPKASVEWATWFWNQQDEGHLRHHGQRRGRVGEGLFAAGIVSA